MPVWIPPWLPQICTGRPGRAIPLRTCSKALSVNIANVLANGIFPEDAIPAATSIIFCSAMPNETVLSGYSSRKWHDLVDFPRSASNTTTRGSSAIRRRPSPYPSLDAPPDEGALMITPPMQFATLHHPEPFHGRTDCSPCMKHHFL